MSNRHTRRSRHFSIRVPLWSRTAEPMRRLCRDQDGRIPKYMTCFLHYQKHDKKWSLRVNGQNHFIHLPNREVLVRCFLPVFLLLSFPLWVACGGSDEDPFAVTTCDRDFQTTGTCSWTSGCVWEQARWRSLEVDGRCAAFVLAGAACVEAGDSMNNGTMEIYRMILPSVHGRPGLRLRRLTAEFMSVGPHSDSGSCRLATPSFAFASRRGPRSTPPLVFTRPHTGSTDLCCAVTS